MRQTLPNFRGEGGTEWDTGMSLTGQAGASTLLGPLLGLPLSRGPKPWALLSVRGLA